jgi:uncharacterized protein YegJ (DUF2314 family)
MFKGKRGVVIVFEENNLQYYCDQNCLRKAGRIRDYKDLNLLTLSNKYVKKAFPVRNKKDCAEHLWVKVVKIDLEKDAIVGIIDNKPVYDSGIKEGQSVTVLKREIELIYNSETEDFE